MFCFLRGDAGGVLTGKHGVPRTGAVCGLWGALPTRPPHVLQARGGDPALGPSALVLAPTRELAKQVGGADRSVALRPVQACSHRSRGTQGNA